MITIHLEEFVNGFSIRGYNSKEGDTFLNEIHEERVEVLRALYQWVGNELSGELKRRESHATEM